MISEIPSYLVISVIREERKMMRQISTIALIALVATFGLYASAQAADADSLLHRDGASGMAAGPEVWAKLYPMPAYEFGLTASG